MFSEPSYSDQDGIEDDIDQCSDTETDAQVGVDGCSVGQALEQSYEPFFADKTLKYISCVYATVVKAYSEDRLTRHEARRIYYRAIFG